MKEILTEKELLDLLQVSRTTMWNLRKSGLPFIKVGREYRYIWGDVLAWLKDKTICDVQEELLKHK